MQKLFFLDLIKAMRTHVNRVWLGGMDAASQGNWYWHHSGEALQYNGWYPTQPNSNSISCINYNRITTVEAWTDQPCSFRYSALCEY